MKNGKQNVSQKDIEKDLVRKQMKGDHDLSKQKYSK
jgi:hypothetical protein